MGFLESQAGKPISSQGVEDRLRVPVLFGGRSDLAALSVLDGVTNERGHGLDPFPIPGEAVEEPPGAQGLLRGGHELDHVEAGSWFGNDKCAAWLQDSLR